MRYMASSAGWRSRTPNTGFRGSTTSGRRLKLHAASLESYASIYQAVAEVEARRVLSSGRAKLRKLFIRRRILHAQH